VTTPQRIRLLLDDHRLEAGTFDDREIVGLWVRAVTSYRDSSVAGLSDEGAFSRAYDAGRQVAGIVLAAAGYRVRGQCHHQIAFYALAVLEDVSLSPFGTELESIRQARHMAIYDAVGDPAALRADRQKLKGIVERFLPAAHVWLIAKRPHLKGKLLSP
jgi:hypothetical protein